MPRITAFESAGRRAGGQLLHVDGEPVCHVPEHVRMRLGLRVGDPLTGPQLKKIIAECGVAETREAALHYLSYRPRTRTEVLRYLRGKGLGAHAEVVLTRCEELGYVDDEAYAVAFARERIRVRPRGRPRLVSELLTRGVAREIAERAAAGALEEEGVTEEDLLREAAVRRMKALRGLEPTVARRRLKGFLLRRGFRAEAVRTVVDELLSDTFGGVSD